VPSEKRPSHFSDEDRIFSLSSMTSPVWQKRREKERTEKLQPSAQKKSKLLADLDVPSTSSSSFQIEDDDDKKDQKTAMRRQSTTATLSNRKRKR
jgi:hypothetical protein